MRGDVDLGHTVEKAPARNARSRRLAGRWLRRVLLGALVGGTLGALGFAFRPRPLDVDAVAASRGDLSVTIDEAARTRVRDRYVVSAPLGGAAPRIALHAGDTVSRGDVLARLVPMPPTLLDPRSRAEAEARAAATVAADRQAKTGVTRAEAAASFAESELERTRRLTDAGALPADALARASLEGRLRGEELASARFAAQATAQEAAMAAAVLRRYDEVARHDDGFEVVAPVDGRVLRVLHESAGPVQPGTPLLELGDASAIEVVADVLTADAVRITPGCAVTVRRWGGEALHAHVRNVEPSAFTRISALGVEEQRVTVLIDLEDARERWSRLGDGFRVEVEVTVEERRGVLRVPLGAIFRRGEGWATYAVHEGRARLAPVRLGVRSDTEVEIVSGITEGELVVVHPGERVTDGVRLAVR